jgi:phosphatidate phosphatase APP1
MAGSAGPRDGSALTVPDAGPHPPLLLAEFPPTLTRFLDAHAILHVADGAHASAVVLAKVVRWTFPRCKHPRWPSPAMIVFFPTYASRTPEGWTARLAGMVARPLPERSRRRVLAVAVLRRLLDLDEAEMASEIFRRRAEMFLFRRVAGHRVRITLGDRVVDAGLTDKAGHFETRVAFDDDFSATWGVTDGPVGRRLEYAGVADPDGDEGDGVPTGTGCVHLVGQTGLSVISDIDDTVKFSNVADKRELLRNTLLREFTAVAGMPEVYRRWREAGAEFHYVSSSPWQLSDPLCRFLGQAGLPAGSMHLKLFRLKDSTPLGRLPSRKRGKRRTIDRILDDFPSRRFVLVGDSGERDPEIYAAIARRRPAQVAGILIREIPATSARKKVRERLAKLARRLPAECLRVFQSPDELADLQTVP